MIGTGKTFSSIKLENLLFNFKGLNIEHEINDIPRRVTDYHFCKSQPKIRNNPQLSGISKKAIEMLGLNYADIKI
jgi:hypothetical protein